MQLLLVCSVRAQLSYSVERWILPVPNLRGLRYIQKRHLPPSLELSGSSGRALSLVPLAFLPCV